MLYTMTSIFNSVFLFSGLIVTCYSNVNITRDPQTVSNATLGGTVRFECQTNTPHALPGWNINGTDYRVTELPLGYYFHNNLNSKVLIVSPVEMEMNNSVYFCYLTFHTSEGRRVRLESQRAMIIIQALKYISSLTSATLQVQSSPTTSVYSPSPLLTSSVLKDITSTLLYTGPLVSMSAPILKRNNYPIPTSVPKMMKRTNVIVGGAIAATAALILLSTSTIISLAVWIRRYRKRKEEMKSSKKYTQQDYAEIIDSPPVYPNPSYEHCKLKVGRNPAYEFNKPQPYTSSNPRDHVYDVVMELQNS